MEQNLISTGIFIEEFFVAPFHQIHLGIEQVRIPVRKSIKPDGSISFKKNDEISMDQVTKSNNPTPPALVQASVQASNMLHHVRASAKQYVNILTVLSIQDRPG